MLDGMRGSTVLAFTLAACGAASGRAAAQSECVGFVELQIDEGGTNGIEALAAADLDANGDVDLVTASYGDGRVLWHENVGGGQFVTREISDGQDGASDVFVADVDGDGSLDVLSAARTSGRISWFRSHRDPGAPPVFSERTITSSVDVPLAVFAADVDGDGDLDVLSAGFNDDTIAWYENGGTTAGVFPSREIATTADGAADVFAVDLDGDTDVDVLSASRFDGAIAFYENDGAADPAFVESTIAIAPGATSVVAADLDGDGDVDIAATSLDDDTVSWYQNLGTGPANFPGQVVSTAAVDPVRVVVADVDGDGRPDLLTAGRGSDSILWHRNLGGTPLAFATFTVSSTAVSAQSVAAGDLDGDGDTDVVSTASVPGFPATGDELAWYENQGATVFPEHAIFGGADGAVAVVGADLDGDGDTDVATAGRPDKVAWQENLGGPGPQFEERPVSSVVGASAIVAVDFDLDTVDVDLVSAGAESGVVVWHENDGSGSFVDRPISSIEVGVQAIDVADLDGDGDLDVLTALPGADTVAWLESDGGAPPVFARHVVVDDADGATAVDTGDIDGDGDLDVVVASAEDDNVAWFESDGATPPTFVRHDVTTTTVLADGASAVLAVDLDEDGDVNIVVGATGENVLAWYANDGASPIPAFTRRLITVLAPGVSSIVSADFDANGDLDLAAATPANGAIFWYENDGATPPVFTPILVSVSADQVRSIAVADVDQDGLPDLLAGQRLKVTWFRATHEICQNFDASGDGRIDGVELAWLGRAFGSVSADPSAEWWANIDFDGSGGVDGDDLALLVTSGVFGATPDECQLVCEP